MAVENPQRQESLSPEQLVKKYWGVKSLLRWWGEEVHDFDEDISFVRRPIYKQAISELEIRNRLIAQNLPELREKLGLLEKEITEADPDSEYLIAREPEQIRPLDYLRIRREIDAPDFVKDFIAAVQLCSEEQMDTVISCLVAYFGDRLEPYKPTVKLGEQQ